MFKGGKTAWIWVLISLVLLIVGQLCNKLSADKYNGYTLLRFINPLFIGTFIILIFRGITWFLALKKIPISVAYPILSISYPVIFVISYMYFNEPLGIKKMFGIFFIVSGLILSSFK